jgi:LysM repeat protein
MTDRGLPSADGSPACPFVAFEDDRDERADRPDHRHRCFAEPEPAPRALAHQEAYCLSSAFPVCPTFQDWARREAAHAIPGAATRADDGGTERPDEASEADEGIAATGAAMGAAHGAEDDDDLWSQARPEPPIEERPRRNPPRDWAAPPPWAASGGAAGPGGGRRGGSSPESVEEPPEESRGLAGSAADRLARGGDIEDVGDEWGHRATPRSRSRSAPDDSPAAPADPELAGLVGRAARQAEESESHREVRPPTRAGRRPPVSSTRDLARERDRGRERGRDHERDHEYGASGRVRHDGPSWERERRSEAYPSIRTRAGLAGVPAVPTIGILFGGVLLAAVILFFLPALLGVGGRDGSPPPGASASPSSAVSTPSASPTPVPEPTPQVYVIKSGDTLSKIARDFNVTLDALLEANKDRITNPNRIRVGDEIIIPLPETEVPAEASPSPS